jgi:hypothetical protein
VDIVKAQIDVVPVTRTTTAKRQLTMILRNEDVIGVGLEPREERNIDGITA